MKNTLSFLLLLALAGCTTATATKTSNGVTESIQVRSFLTTIDNGMYTNGSGISLSVNTATPDSQTILGLAGVLGDVTKAVLALQKTNAVPVTTNSVSK